ncbi:MAG: ferritin-like domain-containing protein [Helicobacteraceae bacterium]|nr:ferritin-like domain-containing protein [Helicobacteraceae bacterium]
MERTPKTDKPLQTLTAPNAALDCRDLALGRSLYLKLENALLLLNKDEILDLQTDRASDRGDLDGWCRLKGHTLLATLEGEEAHFLIRKNAASSYAQKADWGVTLPRDEEGAIKVGDWLCGATANIEIKAPEYFGLMPRGAAIEAGSPIYPFSLNHKKQIWSRPIAKLYEEAKNAQWNASRDIAWDKLPKLPDFLERAIAQIMTYLAENEFSALYIPGKFISRINPHYMEVVLFLASLINDEARHIEAFVKRAMANGGGLQYSSAVTQRSLYSLFVEEDYLKTSFLLHIMGEGTFLDLLSFLEENAPDEVTKRIVTLAKADEARHVAYGMAHVKANLEHNPYQIRRIKEATHKRKAFLDEMSGESTLLIEALAKVAGGSEGGRSFKAGLEAVDRLKARMNKNRVRRLIEVGIDEKLAIELSAIHTPNFM